MAILPITSFAKTEDDDEKSITTRFGIAYDGKNMTNINSLKYLSVRGTVTSVSVARDYPSASEIMKKLNDEPVGSYEDITLGFSHRRGTIKDGVVYDKLVTTETYPVFRVPELKTRNIYVKPDAQIEEINRALKDMLDSENPDLVGKYKAYIDDESKVTINYWGSRSVVIKYLYGDNRLPIDKTINIVKVNTIPAVINKDFKPTEKLTVEKKLEQAVNIPSETQVEFTNLNDLNLKTSGNKIANFRLTKTVKNAENEETETVYEGNLKVIVPEKTIQEDKLVKIKANISSDGVQGVEFPENKLQGSYLDGRNAYFQFEKDTDLKYNVTVDNYYKLNNISLTYNTILKEGADKYNTRTVTTKADSGKICINYLEQLIN